MDSLDKLFYWRGIANEYYNYRGELVQVSTENRVRLLNAMGVDTATQEAVDEAAYALDIAPWQHWLAPFLLTEESHCIFEMNVSPNHLGLTFEYVLTLEDGSVQRAEFVPADFEEVGDYLWEGVRYGRRAVTLGDTPIGYHTLDINIKGEAGQESAQLVVVPNHAYSPNWVDQGDRPWGIIVQLYTLRSARNWGIGDFSDLKLLIRESASAGADMIGLNPLHTLCTPVEHHCSPYSPSDRRFISPLYIDPEIEPDFQRNKEALLPSLVALRASDHVEYGKVFDLKQKTFEGMYAHFVEQELENNTARAEHFRRYVADAGHALYDYCVFQTYVDEKGDIPLEVGEQDLAHFVVAHRDRIQFHEYLQWLANEQLDACQQFAEQVGMKVGLMRDLAVGADGGGSEVITNIHLFCREAAVGAPPDPLAEKGQNWGLPPMDPATLRQSGFEHFINLLRSNMSHCGALRIDHAMSILRLWWCPPGKTADFGAYIYYPFREMLGLLKLESVRNQCLVIGEDMGVVPPELREALYTSHIFTNKLFYFEKNHEDRFKAPHEYEARSLAMLTNHDVPTLASWWIGSDLELRQELDLLEDGVDYQDVLSQREGEKHKLLEWLDELGLLEDKNYEALKDSPMSHELASIILHGASQCASQLFVAQLEDLELLEKPVNVPGTSFQYPNWRRKLAVPLELIFAENRVKSLLQAIATERQ